MMKKLALIAILLLALAVFATLWWIWDGDKKLCEWRDGKWASSMNGCILRDCYAKKNCGKWAAPIARCNRLHAGDSVAEAWFQLGEPDNSGETQIAWNAYKASHQKIVAQVKGDAIASIHCPKVD